MKIVFVGNRGLVLQKIIKDTRFELVHAFIVGDSIELDLDNEVYTLLNPKGDKGILLSVLKDLDFDVCVSAGCPYLLKKSEIPKSTYINCHPSPLPFGKGKHPINHAIMSDEQLTGATIHFLTDELDGGDIIEQEVFKVTDDLDVEILYPVLFDLESRLLIKSLERIYNGDITAIRQVSNGNYYSRPDDGVLIIAEECSSTEMDRYLRSFCIKSQGFTLRCSSQDLFIISGKKIYNEYFVEMYSGFSNGEVCLLTDCFAIIKVDGCLFKVNRSL